jgi:restriction system protein
MPIPAVTKFRAPLLSLLGDGRRWRLGDAANALADLFQLTPEEREISISSGYPVIRHRTTWAGFHLRKAGLVQDGIHGILQLTPEGQEFLKTRPDNLSDSFLRDHFPKYREWKDSVAKRNAEEGIGAHGDEADEEVSPEEQIEAAEAKLKGKLAAELLLLMAKMDPFRFEQLVVDLLFSMGYGGSREEAAKVTKKTGDEGIDGVINEDRLGLDVVYVQAKRWQSNVGRNEIMNFVGALAGKHAHKGIFITTSGFNTNATDYARSVPQKVILIDGQRLSELMIEHNVGVTTTRKIALKRIDSDYFEEL